MYCGQSGYFLNKLRMSAFVCIVLDIVILVHGQKRVKFPSNMFYIFRASSSSIGTATLVDYGLLNYR